MPESFAERAPGAISRRQPNPGPMAPFALPLTEVLVVADGWRAEPDAEAVIHRAVAAAAETVHAGLNETRIGEASFGEAELAVMLTDDAGIRTLNRNWRGIDKTTNVLSSSALQLTVRY